MCLNKLLTNYLLKGQEFERINYEFKCPGKGGGEMLNLQLDQCMDPLISSTILQVGIVRYVF